MVMILVCVALLSVLLGGCDNTPNPGFEQNVQAQPTGSDDPYAAMLQKVPRYSKYLQAAPELRAGVAMQEAMTLSVTYVGLLKKLEREPPVAETASLTQLCLPSLTRAGRFHADTSINAENARAAADPLLAELAKCREAAIAVEGGKDKDSAERANVFRRFASTGMLLVSVGVTARGEESGLELWRQNTDLAMKDRPGFKFSPRMLIRGS